MQSTALETALLALFVVLSAFFSSTESAFLSLQHARVRAMARAGRHGAARVARMAERPDILLPTVLLGNNLVNTAAATLGTAVMIDYLGDSGLSIIVATLGVTTLLLVFGEVLPKTLATRHATAWAFISVRPLEVVETLLLPGVRLLQALTRVVIRLFGGRQGPAVTEEDIRALIMTGMEAGSVEGGEAALLEKVFHFGDRLVGDVMVPRTEVAWVERGTTFQQFMSGYVKAAHTRYPVYSGNQDNVVGVLSVKDVFKRVAEGRVKPHTVVTYPLQAPYFVPESKRISAAFAELQSRGLRMAIVVDEFGGVAGIITLQQLVEVIVGPVGPEGAAAPKEYRAVDANTYQVEGGMTIEEANAKLGLGLPEGDYQTVAGFVLDRLGHIPREGERLDYHALRITVRRLQGARIEEVVISRAPKNSARQEVG